MASKTGYKNILLKLNIPNTQPSGTWSGVNTPITYLDKGTYLCSLNVQYVVGSGTGNITQTFTNITTMFPWSDNNTNVICSSPLTGAMGIALTQPMVQNLANTFTVTSDNTPIYIQLQCNLTGTWGLTINNNSNLNVISFTKLSY
jgi:hypothetical protein